MKAARDPRALLASASDALAAAPVLPHAPRWCVAELAGRLSELAAASSGAAFSAALALVVDAQRCGETAAWVGLRTRTFFPPDARAAGVDLAALPVVRVARERELAFAADVLARSGAFGLVVLELGAARPALGVLARLASLARAHAVALVLLTEKPPEEASLSSVVSLRADSARVRQAGGDFLHELCVARDRVRAQGWRQIELRHGPPGLP